MNFLSLKKKYYDILCEKAKCEHEIEYLCGEMSDGFVGRTIDNNMQRLTILVDKWHMLRKEIESIENFEISYDS